MRQTARATGLGRGHVCYEAFCSCFASRPFTDLARRKRPSAFLTAYPFPHRSKQRHARAIPASRSRIPGPEILERTQLLPRRGNRRQGQVLLPVDVPLPERQAAHGPRAQLHHRRRDQPLPAHAGQERAATDGLGRFRHAGGKRRDEEQRRPGRLDLRQHRLHEVPAEQPGPGDRLVA
ncbi:hypothetical protein D9M71_313910 [compost metagenome]